MTGHGPFQTTINSLKRSSSIFSQIFSKSLPDFLLLRIFCCSCCMHYCCCHQYLWNMMIIDRFYNFFFFVRSIHSLIFWFVSFFFSFSSLLYVFRARRTHRSTLNWPNSYVWCVYLVVLFVSGFVCSYSWLSFNDESRSISCVVTEQRPTSRFGMGWHHKIKCTENLPTRSAKQHRCRRINQTCQGRRSQIDWAQFE